MIIGFGLFEIGQRQNPFGRPLLLASFRHLRRPPWPSPSGCLETLPCAVYRGLTIAVQRRARGRPLQRRGVRCRRLDVTACEISTGIGTTIAISSHDAGGTNKYESCLRPGRPHGISSVDDQRAQRENQHHAIERRSGKHRQRFETTGAMKGEGTQIAITNSKILESPRRPARSITPTEPPAPASTAIRATARTKEPTLGPSPAHLRGHFTAPIDAHSRTCISG